MLKTTLLLPLRALLLSSILTALPDQAEAQAGRTEAPKQIYKIGIASADVDTQVEKYKDTINGIDAQCSELNSLVESICCRQYAIGCNVEYVCSLVSIEKGDLLTEEPYWHSFEGRPNYAFNHANTLFAVLRYLGALQLYGKLHGALMAGFTRHVLYVDDEETKDPSKKINPEDLRFHLLGRLVPGLSARGGRQIILNYYAAREGLFLAASPSAKSSLAQAVSEYRANLFSFDGKKLTGTGARDLFELNNGDLVPNEAGCEALCETEPHYYRFLLRGYRETSSQP